MPTSPWARSARLPCALVLALTLAPSAAVAEAVEEVTPEDLAGGDECQAEGGPDGTCGLSLRSLRALKKPVVAEAEPDAILGPFRIITCPDEMKEDPHGMDAPLDNYSDCECRITTDSTSKFFYGEYHGMMKGQKYLYCPNRLQRVPVGWHGTLFPPHGM
mmetsp:Transcript_53106/g.106653  ORF Transcript_53106/g.106653 Transcript_53106/m.106653 type:complete len:160 (-) Transcript_53106:154-633(-)